MPIRTTLAAGLAIAFAGQSAAAPGNPPPAFAACAACHSTSVDGAHGMGPNLRGVVGRRAGAQPGFGYSKAMKASGVVWTAAELDAFLAAPRKRVPNTSMAFFGIPDPVRRQTIVQYMAGLK